MRFCKVFCKTIIFIVKVILWDAKNYIEQKRNLMNATEYTECEATGKTLIKSEPPVSQDTTPKKIVGIYGLRNKINGKWYIGQSTDILQRWRDYETLRCTRQPKIYSSLLKYGFYNFEKILLEKCEKINWILDYREMYWIRAYNSFLDGYNLTEGGKPNLNKKYGGRNLSPEHRQKLSDGQLGRKHPKQTIDKMSNSAKNRWNGDGGLEMKIKMSKIQTGRKKTPEQISKTLGSKNGQYGKCWITDGVSNRTTPSNEKIPAGWKKGRTINYIISEETKRKMREARAQYLKNKSKKLITY